MEGTLKQTLYWPRLRDDICRYDCQIHKKPGKKYGHLPPKVQPPQVPWNRVDIDLIGPFKVKTPKGVFELRALTMIDPATGWFEIKDVAEPTAACVMAAFDDTWLSRYPRPQFLGSMVGPNTNKCPMK